MEIKEIRYKEVVDMQGKVVKEGDCVTFKYNKVNVLGVFKGFGKRGALEFESIVNPKDTFAIMPAGISYMYVLDFMKDYVEQVRKEF